LVLTPAGPIREWQQLGDEFNDNFPDPAFFLSPADVSRNEIGKFYFGSTYIHGRIV